MPTDADEKIEIVFIDKIECIGEPTNEYVSIYYQEQEEYQEAQQR